MDKKWYQSKTVWFNILTIGSMVLSGVGGLLPALGPVLSVEVYKILLFTVGVVNVVLRSLTTGPIKWKEPNVKSD